MSSTARASYDLPPALQREFSRRTEVASHYSSSRSLRPLSRSYRNSLLVAGNLYAFGKDAPKWTIPSSRQEPCPLQPSPGPGDYETEVDKMDHRIPPKIVSSRLESRREPLTATIGFIDRPEFSDSKGLTIGKREKFEFCPVTPGPGPGKYAPPSCLNLKKCHLIASRHVHEHVNDNPGPGKYDIPGCIQLQRQGVVNEYEFNRTEWMTNGTEVTPAPTDYSPVPIDDKAPIGTNLTGGRIATSLGDKNRGKRTGSNKNVVAVDMCLVSLNKVEDPENAKKYLQSSKNLKELVHELYEIVLNEKPKDPLQFLKDYFIPEVKELPPQMEEDYDEIGDEEEEDDL